MKKSSICGGAQSRSRAKVRRLARASLPNQLAKAAAKVVRAAMMANIQTIATIRARAASQRQAKVRSLMIARVPTTSPARVASQLARAAAAKAVAAKAAAAKVRRVPRVLMIVAVVSILRNLILILYRLQLVSDWACEWLLFPFKMLYSMVPPTAKIHMILPLLCYKLQKITLSPFVIIATKDLLQIQLGVSG